MRALWLLRWEIWNAAVNILVRTETDQAAIVAVHLVAQSGGAVGVETHHSVEIHGGSVGVDDAAPGNLHAVLPVGNAGIILSDQTRSLGDQEV